MRVISILFAFSLSFLPGLPGFGMGPNLPIYDLETVKDPSNLLFIYKGYVYDLKESRSLMGASLSEEGISDPNLNELRDRPDLWIPDWHQKMFHERKRDKANGHIISDEDVNFHRPVLRQYLKNKLPCGVLGKSDYYVESGRN